MEKQREPGYYWVKRTITWHGPPEKKEVVWEVAKYKYGRWYLPGMGICDFNDSYFDEIDENRIERRDVEAMNAKNDIKPPTEEDIAKFYGLNDEPLSNYPKVVFNKKPRDDTSQN